MTRFWRRLRQLERLLMPDEDPTFALIMYDSEEERDQKFAALPPSVTSIVALPRECKSIEEWEAELKADEDRRRRERENEHSDLRLIEGLKK
jgi:hypothetical protein